MATVELTPAAAADLQGLRTLCRRSILEVGRDGYDPTQLEAWAAFTREPGRFRRFVLDHRTWVARVQGEVAGFAGLAHDGHVVSLFVAPEYVGAGVGRALLEALLTHGREAGIERFHAEASLLALPVFLRLGFRDEGREEVVRDGTLLPRHRVVLEPEAS